MKIHQKVIQSPSFFFFTEFQLKFYRDAYFTYAATANKINCDGITKLVMNRVFNTNL